MSCSGEGPEADACQKYTQAQQRPIFQVSEWIHNSCRRNVINNERNEAVAAWLPFRS
jgi:hypothetical protein